MKVNFNLQRYSSRFAFGNSKETEPGSVEYNNPHFLEQEKAEAKARIAKYIEENETAEVLKPKAKTIFSKIEDAVKSSFKKIKK